VNRTKSFEEFAISTEKRNITLKQILSTLYTNALFHNLQKGKQIKLKTLETKIVIITN